MHDAVATGGLVVAVFFGVLVNQRGLNRLGGRVDSRFSRLEDRVDRMQSELSRVHGILCEHGGKIEMLLKR
jgi:hypothetical protein